MHAADAGKRHRLQQKLHADVRLARADRFADADLAGPLRHRDQHDVHHPDAAHQQADGADHAGEQHQRAGQLVPQVGEEIRVGDLEIVLRVVRHVAAAAHGLDHLVARRRPGRRRSRDGEDEDVRGSAG